MPTPGTEAPDREGDVYRQVSFRALCRGVAVPSPGKYGVAPGPPAGSGRYIGSQASAGASKHGTEAPKGLLLWRGRYRVSGKYGIKEEMQGPRRARCQIFTQQRDYAGTGSGNDGAERPQDIVGERCNNRNAKYGIKT